MLYNTYEKLKNLDIESLNLGTTLEVSTYYKKRLQYLKKTLVLLVEEKKINLENIMTNDWETNIEPKIYVKLNGKEYIFAEESEKESK